jgi:hypothetical protein
MDEYQLVDAMKSTMAQAWTVSQYGLSIMTGYLLMLPLVYLTTARSISNFLKWRGMNSFRTTAFGML